MLHDFSCKAGSYVSKLPQQAQAHTHQDLLTQKLEASQPPISEYYDKPRIRWRKALKNPEIPQPLGLSVCLDVYVIPYSY